MNFIPWRNQNQEDCIGVILAPEISSARAMKSACSYFGSGRTNGGGTYSPLASALFPMKNTSPPPVVSSTNSCATTQLRSVTGATIRTVPSVKAPAARSPARVSPPPSHSVRAASSGASRMKLSRSSVSSP